MDRRWVVLLILAVVTLSGCLAGPTAGDETAEAPTQREGVDSTNLRVQNTDDVRHTLSVSVETPNKTFIHPLRVPPGTTETVDNISSPNDDPTEYNITVRALGGPERSHRWNVSAENNLTVRYDGDEIGFGQAVEPDKTYPTS
jgi:hypothetical protein